MGSRRSLFYVLTRNLHLYIGLFLSPFVLVFAVSVILLNHPGIPLGGSRALEAATLHVEVPPGFDRLEDIDRVRQAREIMRQADVSGEVGFVGYSRSEGTITIPVSRPWSEATVRVSAKTGMASITQRRTGFLAPLIFLHKMPGPHLANIRGNWAMVRAWGWLANGTAWLLLFLALSGIYLWAILKSERTVGLFLIVAGLASFLGALYAICR
ncbi:MAG TPA: PepSY-associated TM helix domain-containing protein [Acidobacteriota bacterium]|nr:PepSY-associated TM helix domain-containing protein [Acidobacteriota bacterium]